MIFRPFFSEFFESPKISTKFLRAYHIKKQADHGLTGSTITLASRGLEEPAHALRGLDEFFSSYSVVSVFGSGGK